MSSLQTVQKHWVKAIIGTEGTERLLTVEDKSHLAKTLRKKMGDFIEPGTHRSTNIKVKIETL